MKKILALIVLLSLNFAASVALGQDAAMSPAATTNQPTQDPAIKPVTTAQATAAKAEAWVETAVRYAVELIPKVTGALLVLVLSFIIASWIRRVVLTGLTSAKLDNTLARFASNMARWGILLLGFMAAAGTFGINITGFAAILGAIGLAISLGFQGTLSNLASGILLLVFRPFKVGDSIVAAGQAGIVDAIDLFTTSIDTPDNRRIIVPNGAIFSGTIENVTHHDRRKIDIKVPVAPDADVAMVRRVLQDAAASIANVPGSIEDPAPAIAFVEITPPTWNVAVWAQTSQFGGVREALNLAIKRGVDTSGIGVKLPAPVVIVRD